MSNCYVGTFLKIKIKQKTIPKTKYCCKNHTDDYCNEIMNFCSKCGSKLETITFDSKFEEFHPTYHVPKELIDDTVFIYCNENFENIVISNFNYGLIAETNYTISLKNIDMESLITEFKFNHKRYLDWLDSEQFEYVIDFGVVHNPSYN